MASLDVTFMVSRVIAIDDNTPDVVPLSWIMWGMTFAIMHPKEASKFYNEVKTELKLRTGDPLEAVEREFELIARYIATGD